MNRIEAIEYLEKLKGRPGICYECGECGGLYDCKLQDVIDLLQREQENDDRLDALRYAVQMLDRPILRKAIRETKKELALYHVEGRGNDESD